MAAAAVLLFHFNEWSSSFGFATTFYIATSAMLIWMLMASARRKNHLHMPVARGRVVAVVPAYNEPPELLYACVESLLNQTVMIDEIIVMDDGSSEPVEPIPMERVTWKRQHNRGKRHAQINALEGQTADFIVTVDSDSIVAPDAVEHLLRAMSDPRVQAATGAVLVRNRDQNLLTRIVDLEIGIGNQVMRRAKSSVGAVTPTSGALAIYRSEIIFDHADEYVRDGTYSDDRRLTHYSLQRGTVVAVDEALVETELPATFGTTFRQRVRWYKGTWNYLLWEVRNLTGWALYLRCWNLLLVALYPAVIVWAFVVFPLAGGRFYWEAIAYWLGILYGMTSFYVTDRAKLSMGSRLSTWLLLTPLLVLYQTFLVKPSMYYAITQVRNTSWSTRAVRSAAPKHRRSTPSRRVTRAPRAVPQERPRESGVLGAAGLLAVR
jgi:hyaluronan synthase